MLWFWETETQWLKEQVCGSQYKWESLISGNTILLLNGDGWETATDTSDCQNTRFMIEG